MEHDQSVTKLRVPSKNIKTRRVMNMIIKTIGIGGLYGIAVMAPNALQALDKLGVLSSKTPRQKRAQLLAELRRQGLIITTQEQDQIRFQLTVKGIHRLQRLEVADLEIATPKQWDKHWRMVVFDIPMRYKDQRYIFLSQLRRLGFVMVRQSTWYHAYPCFDVVDQLVRHCSLSQFVTTAEIIRLDESTTRKLLRHFPSAQ